MNYCQSKTLKNFLSILRMKYKELYRGVEWRLEIWKPKTFTQGASIWKWGYTATNSAECSNSDIDTVSKVPLAHEVTWKTESLYHVKKSWNSNGVFSYFKAKKSSLLIFFYSIIYISALKLILTKYCWVKINILHHNSFYLALSILVIRWLSTTSGIFWLHFIWA